MAFVDRTDAEALRVGPFKNENDYNLATINDMRMHNVKRRCYNGIICNHVHLKNIWVHIKKKPGKARVCMEIVRFTWL